MKRRDLIRHLEANGCTLKREGGEHSIYWNQQTGQRIAIPRHGEIATQTAYRACDRLGIPRPTIK